MLSDGFSSAVSGFRFPGGLGIFDKGSNYCIIQTQLASFSKHSQGLLACMSKRPKTIRTFAGMDFLVGKCYYCTLLPELRSRVNCWQSSLWSSLTV